YVSSKNLIHPSQSGFLPNHTTYELLLRITESISEAFYQSSVIYSLFIDISKAYDSLWRDGLLFKLREYFHLRGRIFWWLVNFLKNRYGKVVINGISSKKYLFSTGVPQGSSISPLLFLMYMNDLPLTILVSTLNFW